MAKGEEISFHYAVTVAVWFLYGTTMYATSASPRRGSDNHRSAKAQNDSDRRKLTAEDTLPAVSPTQFYTDGLQFSKTAPNGVKDVGLPHQRPEVLDEARLQPASNWSRHAHASGRDFPPDVTFVVESSMGSVTLSAGVISDCFRKNGTLAIIAFDTVISTAKTRVREERKEGLSNTGNDPDEFRSSDYRGGNYSTLERDSEAERSTEVQHNTVGPDPSSDRRASKTLRSFSNNPVDTHAFSGSNSHINARSTSPSNSHSNLPSNPHSDSPSNSHSTSPSNSRSNSPSNSHSNLPSNPHSDSPSNSHSTSPSNSHSTSPSNPHSTSPSNSHSTSPSNSHSNSPSSSHSNSPSSSHSNSPSNSHSNSPSNSHSTSPSNSHNTSPSNSHSNSPSNSHSTSPSNSHSTSPSNSHNTSPSSSHSTSPSNSHSNSPSNSHGNSRSNSDSDDPDMAASDSREAGFYELSVGSTCTMKMAVPELTFARVSVPEMGLTVCAGAGDVVQASVRQEMFRYCGDVGLYLGTDHVLEVSFIMEVKGGGEDDWLKLKASGSVVMSLDSAFLGSVQRPPLPSAPMTGPTDHTPWAVLKVPPHHVLMLSLQEHNDNDNDNDNGVRAAHCTHDAGLPFTLHYGTFTSFVANLTLGDGATKKVSPDGNDVSTVFDENVTSGSDGSVAYNPGLRSLVCGRDVSFPAVLGADVLVIRYDSPAPPKQRSATGFFGEERQKTFGVSLRFSFHPAWQVPEKLADGRWNCSVPHWPLFRQHFPCDLERQCRNGEDEARCPYTTQRCGSGFMAGVGNGSCYFVVRRDVDRDLDRDGDRDGDRDRERDLSWLMANEACSAQGGYLLSINSPEEAEVVAKLLMFRRQWMVADGVFLGLRPARGSNLPHMYRNSWIWSDGTVANYVNIVPDKDMTCAAIRQLHLHNNNSNSNSNSNRSLTTLHCTTPHRAQIVCEADRDRRQDRPEASSPPRLPTVSQSAWDRLRSGAAPDAFTQCPAGHVTHTFLACDVHSACGFAEDYVTCAAPLSPLPPMFKCACADETVPYSVVCDHRPDCKDSSDEDFCVFQACKGSDRFRCSSHQQCVSIASLCDGQQDCMDGSDECEADGSSMPTTTPPPPLFITMDQRAALVVDENASLGLSGGTLSCPETHFTCWESSGDCLPVFLRCNGVADCPGREDEAACGQFTCPGFYRCRGSTTCVHPSHLCDGLHQCPQRDDEASCHTTCPEGCQCYGLAFRCRAKFHVWLFPQLRYLEATGAATGLDKLAANWYLVHLSLAGTGLKELHGVHLPNLQVLDLSDNALEVIRGDSFLRVENLRTLSLAGNPLLLPPLGVDSSAQLLPNLRTLDLSRVRFKELRDDTLTSLGGRKVEVLNLSMSGLERVKGAFRGLENLRVLDLRGCPMSQFPSEVFRGLDQLQTVYTDNYRLCCRSLLPVGFQAATGCLSPDDAVSSCESLLRSNYYRLFVYVFAVLSVMGNVGSLGYRLCVNRRDSTQTASVFVTNLCVSNFLMGVYLVMVGAADWNFRGSYVLSDYRWRHSGACRAAGFLFVLSNEVSVLLVCLMTLDRYLVLRHPLSALAFRKWSAHAASVAVWLAGSALASVPLLPFASSWHFYGRTGICVPLPVSRDGEFPGQGYAFAVFSAVNFVLFLFVAPAQGLIYVSIMNTRHATIAAKSKRSMDLVVARRLVTVVMTDFLCWFPVSVLGGLAFLGPSSSPSDSLSTGDVRVVLALVVLPLNSALNPVLYTLGMVRDLQRSRMREKIREDFLSQTRQARLQQANNDNRAVTFVIGV